MEEAIRKWFFKSLFGGFSFLMVILVLSSIVFMFSLLLTAISSSREAARKSRVLPFAQVNDPKHLQPDDQPGVAAHEGTALIGTKPESIEEVPFAWPTDDKLRQDAFAYFSQKQNWAACLYVSSLVDQEEMSQQARFKLVGSYYAKTIAAAVKEVLSKQLSLPVGFDAAKPLTIFDHLPLSQSLVFIQNMRYSLREQGVPINIANILMKAFIRQRPDKFFQALATDLLNREVVKPVPYAQGRVLLAEGINHNPRYFETFMEMRLRRCYDGWRNAGNAELNWVTIACTKNSQRQVMMSALDSDRTILPYSGYKRLGRFGRWILARDFQNYSNGPDRETMLKAFSEVLDAGKYVNDLMMDQQMTWNIYACLRKAPRWQAALNRQDYDEAMKAFEFDYRVLFGGEVPGGVASRIRELAVLETKLVKRLVDQAKFKRELRAQGWQHDRAVTSDEFIGAMKALFAINRSDLQTVCLAACMINRGEDPRYVHIQLNTSKTMLRKYIADEELDGE